MPSPLQGLKVIELARILAGPWAGQTLADLGAEVIKVEAEQGDDTRAPGDPRSLRKRMSKPPLIFIRAIVVRPQSQLICAILMIRAACAT